jgi:hypothetical protein
MRPALASCLSRPRRLPGYVEPPAELPGVELGLGHKDLHHLVLGERQPTAVEGSIEPGLKDVMEPKDRGDEVHRTVGIVVHEGPIARADDTRAATGVHFRRWRVLIPCPSVARGSSGS